MEYESMVNICLSRFLSVYKITAFYDKISSNVGAEITTFEGCLHSDIQELLRSSPWTPSYEPMSKESLIFV